MLVDNHITIFGRSDKAMMLGLRKAGTADVRIRVAFLLYSIYVLRNRNSHRNPLSPLSPLSSLSFLRLQARKGTWGHAAARRALQAALETPA